MIYNKICKVCGEPFITTSSRRKCCSEGCTRVNQHRKLTFRIKKSSKSTLHHPTCDPVYCKGCAYYLPLATSIRNYKAQHYACHYMYYTDKRRPCPPGYECTVKTSDTSIVESKRHQQMKQWFRRSNDFDNRSA